MLSFQNCAWPASRLGEAIEALAQASGFPLRPAAIENPPDWVVNGDPELLGSWIEQAIAWLGGEAEPVEAPYPDLNSMLRTIAPGLVRVLVEGEQKFLPVLRARRDALIIIGPDLCRRPVDLQSLRAAISKRLEDPLLPKLRHVLETAGIRERFRPRAQRALLGEWLRDARIDGCWLLRLTVSTDFWRQARREGVFRRLGAVLAGQMAEYLLLFLSWFVVGRAVFEDQIDRSWLVAWVLLLFTMIPFRLWTSWSAGRFVIQAGQLMKERLLCGALRLEPEEIRHQGVGQLLGRILESEALEDLALNGGILISFAVIELFLAGLLLLAGAGGWLHVLAFGGWICLMAAIGWAYLRRHQQWSDVRLQMTNELVERLVGHRTRLAQEAAETWHDGEDQALERYLSISRNLDRAGVAQAAAPRGWLVAGLIGLAPAFLAGGSKPQAIAISLGGILLAFQAFLRLGTVLPAVATAVVAWKQVSQIFAAARRTEVSAFPTFEFAYPSRDGGAKKTTPILEAEDLVFHYAGREEPVLRECSLRIRDGDRILLEGPSGGGKSTLASILAGLRPPSSGLILLGGLDRRTLGADGWRRRVVAAPQFHENHVFTETFAFNLLMGRGWPPEAADFEEADQVCRELGLGPLLEKMPSGLIQQVGDMGWQLSHGERSRLYIARTLLQDADLVVLDESFAALDPSTLRQCLECVFRRASSLLVIAHP